DAAECNPWRDFVHLGVSCFDERSLGLSRVYNGNKIGCKGATALANALVKNNLGGNRIGDEGATALANALANNESLQTLDLGGNRIGYKGATALADALASNESLQTLNLWNNNLGHEGATALANVLANNESLQTLSLDKNNIGDKGATALANALAKNESLQTLDLSSRNIGTEGATAQANAPKNIKSLQLLFIDFDNPALEAALKRNRTLNKQSQTSLMQACKNGDISKAERLVVGGARIIGARDTRGQTALFHVCKARDEDIALLLAKLLFKHSEGLSSQSLGIGKAIKEASSKHYTKLSGFLSFIHSLPLAQLKTNALRMMVIKLFDQGVQTLEEFRLLTSVRLSAQDRRVLLQAFADPEQAPDLKVRNATDQTDKLGPLAGSIYKLDSELRKERARVLRHAENHYPKLLRDQEWLRSLGIQNDIPHELSTLGLWLTNAKRGDFETVAQLPSNSGKIVLHVRDLNGHDFVLKSFHLTNEEWRSRFYRQVTVLAQIHSAYIVRIQGAFMQDAHQGCILMPFYKGGDLDAWIRDNPFADLATRRRIAIGLLYGLHDLHSRGFVHCDIKPKNIFLAPSLSPVLGDFDGVQMHGVTMTQPLQTTKQYMAPELRSGTADKVESAVDMFSIGMRPTALEALHHEALHHAAFQVEPVKEASCAICLDLYPADEGVSCADGHFTCKECLGHSVRAAAEPDAHVNFLRDGSMCCVAPDCELLITGHAIATAVPEDFANWLDIVRKHFERDAAAEQERQ
ncbi:NLR family CARD domain-containing protein 3, partial [Hondaea fermentalgiana]